MAVYTCPRVFTSSYCCRHHPDLATHRAADKPGPRPRFAAGRVDTAPFHGLSSLILRFPPNFVRQLSTKARRNCSNIGVAQIVAASWSNKDADLSAVPAASAFDAAATATDLVVPAQINAEDDLAATAVNATSSTAVPIVPDLLGAEDDVEVFGNGVQTGGLPDSKEASFLSSDGSLAIHAGERLGRGIVTDAITTPVVNTSAYFFKKTADLIDFKEKRATSFEYGRYGNPTTVVLEEKISALEGAESTLMLASGMCASTVLLMALVPAGGHIVTTTDCYRKTRIFIETILPKMGISATIIDPADVGALETALNENQVSLFFTESYKSFPQVLAGCISGSMKLVSEIRTLHHILGGALNPNAAYLIIRGMKTLHIRVRQQNSTALGMTKILEAHPKVAHVYYPGLQSHPEHELAKKQMTGFGGVVSFEIDGDLMTTIKFIDALKIPYIAPSFGGCESIVDQPAIMSYWDLSQSDRLKYGIKDNLVRFSFGLEDFEDLKADILQALEKI